MNQEYVIFNLGDIVKFKTEDGTTLIGEIVNVYIVPKPYDLVDINVSGVIYYGIQTDNCTLVE